MTAQCCVVVCGGSRSQRADFIADHMEQLRATAGMHSALLLTASPQYFARTLADRNSAGHNGGAGQPVAVEVRDDNPVALAASYAGRMHAPAHTGPAMLLRDGYSAVAQSLSWEYMRRAAESGAWQAVIRELDGHYTALAALAAPHRAAAVVEELWPRNTRLAALAAGDGLDPVVRDAHELAGTLDVLAAWLSARTPSILRPSKNATAGVPGGSAEVPRVAVHAVGEDAETRHIEDVAELLGTGAWESSLVEAPRRGAPLGGLPVYTQRISVPTEPDATPKVCDGELHLRFSGVSVRVRLAGVLARCTVHAVEFIAGSPPELPHLLLTFVADPELWPESLLAPYRRRSAT